MGNWFSKAVRGAAEHGATVYAQQAKDARQQLIYQKRLDEQRAYGETQKLEKREYDASVRDDAADTAAMENELLQDAKDDRADFLRIDKEYKASEAAKATRQLNRQDDLDKTKRKLEAEDLIKDQYMGYTSQPELNTVYDKMTKNAMGKEAIGASAFTAAKPHEQKKFLQNSTDFRADLAKNHKLAYAAKDKGWGEMSVPQIGQAMLKAKLAEKDPKNVGQYLSPFEAIEMGYSKADYLNRVSFQAQLEKRYGEGWASQSGEKVTAAIKGFEKKFNSPIQGRFIKIKVKNYGVCPDWHLGNGGDTWLFLDEITIE